MLAATALTAMFSACTFEQEDYFDESAALRIQHVNDEIKSVLSAPSSENGWLIQYYVGGTDEETFEGFNLFGKFYETGKVTLSSDHRYLRNGNAGKYTEYTSYYEMLAEEGPVLVFNTWNDILTVFVDPVSPSSAPGALIDDGEGMNGDDRLVVLSYTDDEVLLRGERHSAPIRFVKLDRSPEEYIANTVATKSIFSSGKIDEYVITGSRATRYISGLSEGCFSLLDRLDDPLESETYSCVFTPQGFRLEKELQMGSDENDHGQEFVLNREAGELTSNGLTVKPCWQRALNRWMGQNGTVTITTDGASDAFNAYYNALSSAVTSAFSNQSLVNISFGTSNEKAQNRRTGLVFTMKTSTKTYQVAFAGAAKMDGDKMTLSFDTSDYSSNYSTYEKKGIGSSFVDFANAMNGTYTLNIDNVFSPSKVIATKDGDSSFSFKMNM